MIYTDLKGNEVETSLTIPESNMTLEEQVEHLTSILEDRFDTLNALWRQVEKRLLQLAYGHSITHVYNSSVFVKDGPMVHSALVINRCGLYHTQYRETFEPGHDTLMSIHKCPATIRLAAVIAVPGLYQAVMESTARLLPLCDRAITTLKQVLTPASASLVAV